MIIHLHLDHEEHHDSNWQLDRTYYFIRDEAGNRWSDTCPLPEMAWRNIECEPMPPDEPPLTLDTDLD